MLSTLGHFAAEVRESQDRVSRNSDDGIMNRHLLAAGALHGFGENENPFVRRASAGGGLTLGHGKKRPKIAIFIDGQPPEFRIPSFTTRERITGHVEIMAPCDVPFDDLHITFQGTSRTWVEKIATTAPTNPRTRAFHTFLRLLQPIEESAMPEQHILRQGRVYTIPFEFVVPEHLLPQACSHPRANEYVEAHHLKLPPSLGDAMVSGDGKSLHGDHAPEMTTITYSLRCIITKNSPPTSTTRRPAILADEHKKLRIIPHVDELPPLAISEEPGEDYVVHRIKNVKKGILLGKTKIGKLDVQVKQPAALRLPGVRSAANPDAAEPVMTSARLKLRFDPCKSNIKPPKLQNVWSRLKVATFFATVAQQSLPSKSATFSADVNKGLMVETVPLSALCLGGVQWEKRKADRRDSGFAFDSRKGSVDTSPDESSYVTPAQSTTPSPAVTPIGEDGPEYIYYTAEVTVPLELPYQKHAFVPTFHSCLISRIYALDLSLSSTTGTGNSTNVHLKLPIQICSTGSDNPVPRDGMAPEGGFVGARADHRDAFAPNMVHAEDDNGEAPPDFDDLSLHDSGAAAVAAAEAAVRAAEQPEVDSDGEINFSRPTWTNMDVMRPNDPARVAVALDQQHFEYDGTTSPGARSPTSRTPAPRSPLSSSPTQALRRPPAGNPDASGARSPGARSPSPRQTRLTNDQILNPEDYEGDDPDDDGDPEYQFGTFRFEPPNLARRGDGLNRGQLNSGEMRRASETVPPGYASVAAGTMLMGSGGMVRALS